MALTPTNDKPFEKWTFDELTTWAAWQVAEGLFRGDGLRTIMRTVLDAAVRWSRNQK